MTNLGRSRVVLLVMTLMLSGRAMTLAYIGAAGEGRPGDPPSAWLMPLVGDAIVGITALVVAYLVVRGRGLTTWTVIVVWNVVGIWDAMSALLVQQSVPWPEFFMIKTFGSSMFFAASALHLINLWLVSQGDVRTQYVGDRQPQPRQSSIMQT